MSTSCMFECTGFIYIINVHDNFVLSFSVSLGYTVHLCAFSNCYKNPIYESACRPCSSTVPPLKGQLYILPRKIQHKYWLRHVYVHWFQWWRESLSSEGRTWAIWKGKKFAAEQYYWGIWLYLWDYFISYSKKSSSFFVLFLLLN